MSRCFPYPPPYYEQSLIESIKLRKEKEKVKKEERGKAKKDKKEKKREKDKREKVAQKPVDSQREEKRHKKRKYEEKSLLDQKHQYSRKISNDVIEQLEGSGLTEEHELPSSIQYKHDSPESSQDSNKRRKLIPSISTHNKLGNILRIKLPFLKQGDSDPVLPSSSQIDLALLSPSLRQRDSEPLSLQTVGEVAVPDAKSKQIVQELPAVDEQPCFSGRDAEITAFGQGAAESSHRSSSSKRIGSRTWQKEQFRDLLVNWNPQPLQYESSDAADDWLLGALRRRPSSCTNKREVGTGVLGCGNYAISLQQPRARYLPEFGMCQLPYVIPF